MIDLGTPLVLIVSSVRAVLFVGYLSNHLDLLVTRNTTPASDVPEYRYKWTDSSPQD